MKYYLNILSLFVCLLLLLSLNTLADTISAKVVGVYDGDTITVLEDNKTKYVIRLQGIDAPELDQPFGKESKNNLYNLIYGKDVIVRFQYKDAYGRPIGVVTHHHDDVAVEQILTGYAWHYKKYEYGQTTGERHAYGEAEIKARYAVRGLWVDNEPMAPWNYREKMRASRLDKLKPNNKSCSIAEAKKLSSLLKANEIEMKITASILQVSGKVIPVANAHIMIFNDNVYQNGAFIEEAENHILTITRNNFIGITNIAVPRSEKPFYLYLNYKSNSANCEWYLPVHASENKEIVLNNNNAIKCSFP